MVRKKANNPPSAYAIFIRDIRRKLHGHSVGFTALQVYCTRRWNAMTDEQKQPYRQLSKEVRERMRSEMGLPSRRYKPRAESGPRKLTNYFNYQLEQAPIVKREMSEGLEEGKKIMMRNVFKEVAKRWKQLTPEQQKQYLNANRETQS